MRFTVEQSGYDSFLLYQFDQSDIIETMSYGQILNNKIPGLVPADFRQTGNGKAVFYKITSLVTLEEYLKNPVRKGQLLEILSGILNAAESAQEYMIDLQELIFDKNCIFLDPETLDVSLICLPVMNRYWSRMDLQPCLWNLAVKSKKDKSESREYVADLMEKLDPENALSISEMKSVLRDFVADDCDSEEMIPSADPETSVEDSFTDTVIDEKSLHQVLGTEEDTSSAKPEVSDEGKTVVDEKGLREVLGTGEDTPSAKPETVSTNPFERVLDEKSLHEVLGIKKDTPSAKTKVKVSKFLKRIATDKKNAQQAIVSEEDNSPAKPEADGADVWNRTVIDENGWHQAMDSEEDNSSAKPEADGAEVWNRTVIDENGWHQAMDSEEDNSPAKPEADGAEVWNRTVIDENGWHQAMDSEEDNSSAQPEADGADVWNRTVIDENGWHQAMDSEEDNSPAKPEADGADVWNRTVLDEKSLHQTMGTQEDISPAKPKVSIANDWTRTVIDEKGWHQAPDTSEPSHTIGSGADGAESWNVTVIDEKGWSRAAENETSGKPEAAAEEPSVHVTQAETKTQTEETPGENAAENSGDRTAPEEKNESPAEEKKEDPVTKSPDVPQENGGGKRWNPFAKASGTKKRQEETSSSGKNIPCLIRDRGNEVVRIEGTVFQIGSDYGYCDYQIRRNRTVSSIHAQIIKRGKDFYIKDMNSKAGTFLDEKQIPGMEEVQLTPGTKIRLGSERLTFTMR